MTTILLLDVTEQTRGLEGLYPEPAGQARRDLEKAPAIVQVAASVAVLAGLTNPESRVWIRTILDLLLSSPRKRIQDGVWRVTTPRGREYVLAEGQTEDGRTRLALLHELEWRLTRGEFTLEIAAPEPEVFQ